MGRLALAWQLARHLGPLWLARRACYVASRRWGWIARRDGVRGWQDFRLSEILTDPALADEQALLEHLRRHSRPFFFQPADFERFEWTRFNAGTPSPILSADEVRVGRLPCFDLTVDAPDGRPDWHRNPASGLRAPEGVHWSLISDFDLGDIKYIWEVSRFGFAFDLVRAYARTGNSSYAETFWRLLESWHGANPPYFGPNWKCEQESALRLIACCFGLMAFAAAPETTPARVARVFELAAATGRRIAEHLYYPISQDNNHGMTAAAGLWTIGLLFPELRDAERWKSTGREVLERLARRLIYDDGAFSQHSTNYQRLMLHTYVWSIRLGQLHGEPFADDVVRRVARSAELLYQIQDETTGQAPCYGHHDGALILPLSNCDRNDFRPVLQAAHYLATGNRRYQNGPWDEELLWLFGPAALASPIVAPPRQDMAAESGGYYTLRGPDGFAFTRCASFRHRPSQADLLHVDIWWRGENIALDGGTYRYNASPPWDNALGATAVHNTVSVDGRDQMRKVSRFLWLPWPTAKILRRTYSAGGSIAVFEGCHDGFSQQGLDAIHGRMILRLGPEHYLVLDRVVGQASHPCRLHWLLADYPTQGNASSGLILNTPHGEYVVQLGCSPRAAAVSDAAVSMVRGDAAAIRGWRSPDYGKKVPAISLAFDFTAPGEVAWSLLGPAPAKAASAADELVVETADGRARLTLNNNRTFPICRRAVWEATGQNSLDTWSADA
jgi:asparagine synthase (glutamine-hydrolysing)